MPTRLIRDWTDSDHFDGLSAEAERQFTRLIMKADDYGRFSADWRRVKSGCFPLSDYSQQQIESWLQELAEKSLIGFYEVDSRQYLAIPKFGQRLKHSVPKCPPLPGKSSDWLADYSDFLEVPGSSGKLLPEEKRRDVDVHSDVEVDTDSEVKPPSADIVSYFDKFWNAYPKCDRKKGRKLAKKIWDKEGFDAKADSIIAGLKSWKLCAQWAKNHGEFIPLPTTWLNSDDWTTPPNPAPPEGTLAPPTAEEWARMGLAPDSNPTNEDMEIAYPMEGDNARK